MRIHRCAPPPMKHLGKGIWLLDVPSGPPSLRRRGRRLIRFMDRIYLPGPLEELTKAQKFIVNEARQRLHAADPDKDYVGEANYVVKAILGGLINAHAPASVLEIGCGLQPVRHLLDRVPGYIAADIDPAAVARAQALGLVGLMMDQLGHSVPSASIDLALAVFVAQYGLSDTDIATILALLRPAGVLVMNVYRLTDGQRSRLEQVFMAHGGRVKRINDPLELVRNHEYWLVYRPEHDAEAYRLGADLAMSLHRLRYDVGLRIRKRSGAQVCTYLALSPLLHEVLTDSLTFGYAPTS